MARRVAFKTMLGIPDKTPNYQADAIIDAYHAGVTAGRKEGVAIGRESLGAELRVLLGINDKEPSE
jgi:hypothetical protein